MSNNLYQKMIVVLVETGRIMGEIDGIVWKGKEDIS